METFLTWTILMLLIIFVGWIPFPHMWHGVTVMFKIPAGTQKNCGKCPELTPSRSDSPSWSLFVLEESTQTTDWERLMKTVPGYTSKSISSSGSFCKWENWGPGTWRVNSGSGLEFWPLSPIPWVSRHVTASLSTCSFAGWLLLRKLLMETL